MSLKKEGASGVTVYNLSAGKTLPEWLREKKKTALRYDEDYKKRIELIQHLEFPVASQTVRMTPDGKHLLATGVHSPRFNVYDLKELTLKFERFLTCECIQMRVLADDWKKVALLHADRTIELHAQYGAHFKIRVPRPGRDMQYMASTAELLTAGAGPDVYRLNLEQGQFFAPITTGLPEINTIGIAKTHNLIALGGTDGCVECYDPRDRRCVGRLDVTMACNSEVYGAADGAEVSALEFRNDGLVMASGLSTGQVALFDLRMSTPLKVKDHQYGEKINSIKFHDKTRNIISTDRRICKAWDWDSGKVYTSIEPKAPINSMEIVPDTGMMIMAVEEPRMQIYYVPSLGPAPKWCAFLDSLTEELEEESTPEVYDDYKFVTREELGGLGLDSLIGSKMMRAYMHGFFIDAKLYARAKAISAPYDGKSDRKKQVREKLDAERANRITIERKLPKVNASLAAKLLDNETKKKELHHIDSDDENAAGDDGGDDAAAPSSLLTDPRFAKMFESTEYTVDEESEIYKHHHPAAAAARDKNTKAKRARERIAEHFDLMNEDSDSDEEPAGTKMYELKDGHDVGLGRAAAPAGSKRTKGSETKSMQQRVSSLERRGKASGNKPLAEGSSFQVTIAPSKGKGKSKGSKGKGDKGKGDSGKGKSDGGGKGKSKGKGRSKGRKGK